MGDIVRNITRLMAIVAVLAGQLSPVAPAAALASPGGCVPAGALRQLRWDTGALSRVWLQSCVRTPPGRAIAVGVWSLGDRVNVREVDVLTSLLRKDGAVLKAGPCIASSRFPVLPDDAVCDGPDLLLAIGPAVTCYAHIRVRVSWSSDREPSTTEFLDSKLVTCGGS